MTFGKVSEFNWSTYLGVSDGSSQFKVMTGNRKRSRDDDASEFMPLSKRINNLRINNGLCTSSSIQSQESNTTGNISSQEQDASSSNSSTESQRTPSYDPGLNSSQSVYFYDNKLLFELHLERMLRSGQHLPY